MCAHTCVCVRARLKVFLTPFMISFLPRDINDLYPWPKGTLHAKNYKFTKDSTAFESASAAQHHANDCKDEENTRVFKRAGDAQLRVNAFIAHVGIFNVPLVKVRMSAHRDAESLEHAGCLRRGARGK